MRKVLINSLMRNSLVKFLTISPRKNKKFLKKNQNYGVEEDVAELADTSTVIGIIVTTDLVILDVIVLEDMFVVTEDITVVIIIVTDIEDIVLIT